MEPRRSRTMEYDPVTGCYVRKVPLDFSDKKVEDIVKEEMVKSERKPKTRSSDASWKNPEEKESGSTPDTALVDITLRSSDGDNSLPHYASGEGIETEYKFTVKEEIKTESKPIGFDKNGEFADEDLNKAGEAMKARFVGDRMKFERDSGDVVMSETTKRSFERRRRSDEDPETKKARDDTKERTVSLDRRLREMEERRARLFKDSPEAKVENSGEVKITRTVTTETSYSAPASVDSMLGERMQDAHRRHRNREERIRRRKNAEELISMKSSEGEDKSKSSPMKSTGVKLELRGSAMKKKEDTSPKSDSEPNAYSGSSYSYRHQDDASDITFTVKKSAETKRDDDDDDILKFDKKESTFDWNESEQNSSVKTTETKTTSLSLMDEPIEWSQPGRGTDDDISFSVKEPGKKQDGDQVKEEKKESRRSQIKETEVKVVESKPVQSLFSNDFGQEEPQDIVFSVKETSTSTKRTTEDDSSKSKPKELTLERGTFDEKYSVTTSNSDLLRWEMDNVDSGKPSEPEPFDSMDSYRDSLRRTNALGRVGSFKKGREELPPAIFHDIESDAPAASLVDIRTESPSPVPVSRDTPMEASQATNLLSKLQDEDLDDERRRRRQEIEEKKRRIAESQKKANVHLRRDASGFEKKKDGSSNSGSPDNIEDLSEKRRSLLMMWESYAEGEGPGPENTKQQEEGKSQFGYDTMMMEAAQSDPNAGLVDYRTMDADDEKEETRAPMIDIDEYHKLNDDELKWERAGQFQPGKIKTKFHEMGKDDSSSEPKNTWRGMNNNDIAVSTRVTREEQRFSYKSPLEEDQSYADETTVVESAPKPLWDESEGQSTFKSDDEDEEKEARKAHVDMDEVHRMTEEEARWEKVGHFQPGKINTSVFESRKKADKSGVESPKIQRREKSRYEQIKKIQRTDSKKELLVPKKVALRSEREEDLEEEEDERPHVGKIDAPTFRGTEEERQRQEREARNRREMEEIQREREEERRRQERENLESKTTINEFEDDEFDAKVKSRDVGRIDITKFSDFQKKSESIPDKKSVSKQSTKRIVETRRGDKVESVTKTNLYSREDEGYDIQFQQGDAVREKPDRKTSDKAGRKGYVQQTDVVVAQTTREVESAPDYSYEEDEYEIKRRSVGKLNKDWLSQAQEQEAREMERRRKENEMERIRKEQYEIEQLKLEESKRRETEGDETSRDGIQLSEKPQSVKKLDSTSMKPFLKGHPSPEGTGGLGRKKNKDEVRQERKLARKESRSKIQTHEDLYAEETKDVQQSSESFDDRPKAVGKLNTGKYLQMMGEDHSDKERRKKLVEEERMRYELQEMERQREEEERRKEMDRDDTSSSSSSDRPQSVSKLDLAQFSQFQKQDTVVMPKKQPAKERTRESKRIEIVERKTVDEVESEPFVPETSEREWLEKERSEALVYEEKRQNVGRLDVNRLMQSRSEEEQERQSRIKELERQRMIREREEMERLKAEKRKGKRIVDQESEISSEASGEDHKASSVKSSGSQHDREREEEWSIEEKRKSGVGRLNVGQFLQSMSKEEEEKNRRKLELEKERIRREAEERERLRMEQQMSSESIKVSTVEEVHSAPDGELYERGNREEREREEEMSVEEKRKSVGRLDVNKFVQSLSDEAEEKRRRRIEVEKERIRRENEEKELLRLEQDRKNREESSVANNSQESSKKYVIVHRDSREPRDERKETERRDNENYTILDREREEEMSVEEKRKSVGRLDVSKYMQSLSQEEEEKRRRMIELEKERIRREEEEKELLRLEQERAMGADLSRTSYVSVTSKSSSERVSRTVVQDVESSPYDQPDEGFQQPSRVDKEREEELSVEEKRKSVGRLDVNKYMQSLSAEEEEKRRRRIEMENERIRRENEERELLRMEQERQTRGQVEKIKTSAVQEVHSAPPGDILTDNDKRSSLEREREEAMSVEEKRKSVGRLDFNHFIQSLSEEDKEKQMRKIELERERLRREKEEREMEEKQYRLRESSSYSEKIQTSNVEVVQSEIPVEYEEGDSSQDKKEVGRLDFQRYSQQFSQEARERERRARELEIERLRLEREEMKGRGGSQTVEHESWSSERRENTVIEEKRKYRGDEVDRRSEGRTESIKSEDSSDSDKPVPKKLDLSKFSAFQSGSGKRRTKDDSTVKLREKSEAGRQARPKSYAGSSFGGVANGEARSGERVYRIIH